MACPPPPSPSPSTGGKLRLAAVVPTLDEESLLERRLIALAGLVDEVVVSDGGSTDATRAIAESHGVRVITGGRGRGDQLNRGAAACDAEVLLFLHADTELEAKGIAALRAAIAGGAVGGGFLCRFDHPGPIYRLGEWIVNLRTRVTRGPLGDQAQFATRAAFEALGGFRDWPLLEDLDFVRRLKRHGRVVVLEPPATTSARRFEKYGIARTIATNWLIFTLFFLGVPPERLERFYR